MQIKGVLWDMDGVLVDTGMFHFEAWSQTLKEHHIPFTRKLFDETFGMNNRSILAYLLGREPTRELVEKIGDQKEESFREIIKGKVEPLPGILAALSIMKMKGVLQGIASSAPIENIDALIDELLIRDYFQAVISGSDLPGKPAPDIFLESARAIGLPPEKCIVIEDAIAGVEGAKNAGMLCLAVTTSHPPEKLSQADFVVQYMTQAGKDFWNLFDQAEN